MAGASAPAISFRAHALDSKHSIVLTTEQSYHPALQRPPDECSVSFPHDIARSANRQSLRRAALLLLRCFFLDLRRCFSNSGSLTSSGAAAPVRQSSKHVAAPAAAP